MYISLCKLIISLAYNLTFFKLGPSYSSLNAFSINL
jgi:hypothetical protein